MELDEPLNGGDRIKIVIFFLLLAATIFFGVIPILIALSGLYVMKKDKSFSPIKSSRKQIKAYLIMLSLGATVLISAAYYNDNTDYWHREDMQVQAYVEKIQQETAMIAGAGLLLTPILVSMLMSLFGFLYFTPLQNHQTWVVNRGVFSDEKESDENDSAGIMGRDKLSAFSVADELMKWNELLDKKIISQDDFDKAKQKLLNPNK